MKNVASVTTTTSNTATLQLVEKPKLKLVKTRTGLRSGDIGKYVTFIVPVPTFTIVGSQTSLRQTLKPQQLLMGKGRFGKRPAAPPTAASFVIEHHGHINDNSYDSGLECDDSQFWGSSEDLRLVGMHRGNPSNVVTTQIPVTNHPILSFQSMTNTVTAKCPTVDTPSVKIQKGQGVPMPSINNSQLSSSNNNTGLLCQLGNLQNPLGQEDKKIFEISTVATSIPSSDVKSMSPDSTVVDVSQVKPTPLTNFVLGHIPQRSPLTVPPVKRSRFSFQTPSIPLRPASALKLRNQNGTSFRTTGKRLPSGTPPTLSSPVAALSRDGKVQLQILAQPEEQHRARYQTEGSRGAIKDRKGNGYPAVKLIGYDRATTLQIFIGSDQGKVSPHMFYQACKVTGKSSTPCTEKKVEGTVIIDIEFEASKENVITCDCVGILKERNVDVEQRFPFHHAASSRKKSTRCRMIFRTTILNSDGIPETLQVSSLPILCTQPPGQPEICKKSLSEFNACGGQELFIVGKNFLKDTKVIVQEETVEGQLLWETKAEVLKDYLQQNHLICVFPPYKDENITKPVDCKVVVWSGGKLSEPHHILYIPNNPNVILSMPTTSSVSVSTLDTQLQSQSLVQTALQPQLSQVLMPLEIPMGTGSVVVVSEPMNTATFIQETSVQPPITSSNASTLGELTFDTSVLPQATTPEERLMVSELQEILEQSSQQSMMPLTDMKPTGLEIGPTSFFGLNLVPMGPNEVNGAFSQSIPITASIQTSLPGVATTMFSELNQDMNIPQTSVSLTGYNTSPRGSFSGGLPLVNLQAETQLQHLPPPSSTQSILDCMNQVLKPEPLSPATEVTSCNSLQGPIESSMMSVMNILEGNMQAEQRSIASALTSMSDNELLSYINSGCFEQDK